MFLIVLTKSRITPLLTSVVECIISLSLKLCLCKMVLISIKQKPIEYNCQLKFCCMHDTGFS